MLAPPLADRDELLSYHSEEYLNTLSEVSKARSGEDSDSESDSEDLRARVVEAGLTGECAAWPGLWKWCRALAGGVLASVELLQTPARQLHTCLYWLGGRHHAKKDEASGFCYINDAVLGVLKLLEETELRILYLDIDIHHGDAVQDAFFYTDKVLFLDFHRFDPGFFPGTGAVSEIGAGTGKHYTINVPLHEGVSDKQYVHLFKTVTEAAFKRFNPQFIFFNCGADCLVGDPLGGFNVTLAGVQEMVRFVDDLRTRVVDSTVHKVPMVVLGGGGYDLRNVINMSMVVSHTLLHNCDEEFATKHPETRSRTDFVESYVTEVSSKIKRSTVGSSPNMNKQTYVDNLLAQILANILHLPNNGE